MKFSWKPLPIFPSKLLMWHYTPSLLQNNRNNLFLSLKNNIIHNFWEKRLFCFCYCLQYPNFAKFFQTTKAILVILVLSVQMFSQGWPKKIYNILTQTKKKTPSNPNIPFFFKEYNGLKNGNTLTVCISICCELDKHQLILMIQWILITKYKVQS